MRNRVNKTVGRQSVRPSVCLSRHSPAARRCGGFAAERRAGDIDRQRAPSSSGAQQKIRLAANASSVTLTADVGS